MRDVDVSMRDFEFTGNITRPDRAVMETLMTVIVEVAVIIPDLDSKVTGVCECDSLFPQYALIFSGLMRDVIPCSNSGCRKSSVSALRWSPLYASLSVRISFRPYESQ